ncbi:MAG: amino acid permease, partial [Blastocatellia bacterium]|nr:amino acid permease [Blastocatellia bacterium]
MPNYRRRKNTGLLKVLGFSFGWAVIIGNTIGAGILRTPGEVASHLPNTWLFITAWLIGGIYALLGALSLTELGVMIPESGGQYTFAKHALGDYAGLIVGWSDWISTSGTSALVSLVIAEYVGLLFGISNPIIGKAIALSVLVVFTLLQLRSIGVGSFVQNLTSILKALLFLMLITVCLLFSGDVNNLEISVRPLATESIFTSMILALQSVIYTYDGWTGVIYFSEEVVVPERDIPRSMIGGVVSVIIIYLFVNLALVYLLPVAQIAGKSLAIGYVMQIIFGKGSETFIQILL